MPRKQPTFKLKPSRQRHSRPVKRRSKALLMHHRHTGRLLPHYHTSFALLAFMVLSVSVLLIGLTLKANAALLNVSASVDGPPPPFAATILIPKDGDRFTTIPIKVSGTCPHDYMVRLYRNNVFSGAIMCSSVDTFELETDLFEGANKLEARIYDAIEREGPRSPSITVYYDPPKPVDTGGRTTTKPKDSSGSSSKVTQLFLRSRNLYKGYLPHEKIRWEIRIGGGTPPYAIHINWGDGTSDVISRSKAGVFSLSHAYKKINKEGFYKVKINASDAKDQKAFLQLVAIVSDPLYITAVSQAGGEAAKDSLQSWLSQLLVAAPLYILALLMAISFWLGEEREKGIMNRLIKQKYRRVRT